MACSSRGQPGGWQGRVVAGGANGKSLTLCALRKGQGGWACVAHASLQQVPPHPPPEQALREDASHVCGDGVEACGAGHEGAGGAGHAAVLQLHSLDELWQGTEEGGASGGGCRGSLWHSCSDRPNQRDGREVLRPWWGWKGGCPVPDGAPMPPACPLPAAGPGPVSQAPGSPHRSR